MTNQGHDDWGDDGELRARLGRYADARLRPDPRQTERVRTEVMAAARVEAGRRAVEARDPRRRMRLGAGWPRPFRLSMVTGAWLVLALMVAGGVAAGSGAGGPLYGARLWVEELLLPGDPGARADAQLARLDARLAEASDAAASGNGPEVTAALDAYRATADAIVAAAGDDLLRREHVALQLGRHVAVLDALAAAVPDRAAEAIQAAIDRTEARIAEILASPGPGTTPPGKPEATPKPERTPPGKPEATPGPGKTPPGKPDKTPPGRPDKTPPGRPEGTPNPPPGKP